MIHKEKSPDGRVLVTFELPPSVWARCITLVGEFNGWDSEATPLCRQSAQRTWRITLALEAGRRYAFRYLVDGKEWLNDLYADDHVINPYGSYDSVVDLTTYPVHLPA